MRAGLAIGAFLIGLASILAFLFKDACLDAGGSWNYWQLNCSTVAADFVPLHSRLSALGWLGAILLASIPAWFIYKGCRK